MCRFYIKKLHRLCKRLPINNTLYCKQHSIKEACSVCYHHFNVKRTNCSHYLCYSCFIKSGNKRCPICRQIILNDFGRQAKNLNKFVKDKDNQIEELTLRYEILSNINSYTIL